jgi:hypothetical protein
MNSGIIIAIIIAIAFPIIYAIYIANKKHPNNKNNDPKK